MIIETIEGEKLFINEKQITTIRKFDKDPAIKLITLACGATYRVRLECLNICAEDMSALLGDV